MDLDQITVRLHSTRFGWGVEHLPAFSNVFPALQDRLYLLFRSYQDSMI